MVPVINLVPSSGLTGSDKVRRNISLRHRVEALIRNVVERKDHITSEINRRVDFVLRTPNYYSIDNKAEELSIDNLYVLDVGITGPKIAGIEPKDVEVQLGFSFKNCTPQKPLPLNIRQELTRPNGYKFALYNHITGLISDTKGFEVTNDHLAAYVNLELGECKLIPYPERGDLQVALKLYPPEPRLTYDYSLIPFLDGIPVIPI